MESSQSIAFWAVIKAFLKSSCSRIFNELCIKIQFESEVANIKEHRMIISEKCGRAKFKKIVSAEN
jgi:hypothetical protein